MRHKHELLCQFVNENKPHILALTETWLDPNVSSDLLIINDYVLHRNDRGLLSTGSREYMLGGGVLCYIHCSLRSKLLYASNISYVDQTEFIILEVSDKNCSDSSRVLITVIYRRPNGLVLNEFFNKIGEIMQSYKNVIIIGDLNIDILTSTYSSSHLLSLIKDYNMYVIPFGPTHFTDSSSTSINLAIVDSSTKVISYETFTAPIAAGHLAINVVYNFRATKLQPNTFTYRDFRNCNFDELSKAVESLLSNLQFTVGDRSTDTTRLVDEFSQIITSSLDHYAPFVTRSFSRRPAPWLTLELKALCKERDALYKRGKRLGNAVLIAQYKLLRKDIKVRMTLARQNYDRNQIAALNDPASVWRYLAKAGLSSQPSALSTQFFSIEELNEFHTSVASAHPLCPVSIMENIANSDSDQSSCSFEFILLTPLDVYYAAKSLISKSTGRSPDNLPLKHLDRLLVAILPVLTNIFNHSLITCTYPLAWKRAFIIPLNKCTRPVSPSDTRPIANLPHLAKIFDKCIARQMLSYLEENHLLSPFQFGFRPGHSTQTALLYLTDRIRSGIEQGLVTLLMSFDLKKAFDSIDHESLLKSLKSLGFKSSAIRWIHSYITGRQQVVVGDSGKASSFRDVTSGVPQGSSPGPILFLALINSLPDSLKFCKSSYALFADYSQFYIQCQPELLPMAIAHFNEEAQLIANWASDHGLQINASKTTATLFGSTSNLAYVANEMVLPPIIVQGQVVKITSQVKSIGVILSSDLTWNAQISSISSKVHGVLHKLRHRAWLLSRDLRILLVSALVLPHIDYACVVYNAVPNYLNLKLQRLVNASVRFIFNLPRDSYISRYRQELQWLTVLNRRKWFIACQLYNILANKTPLPLYDNISDYLFGEQNTELRRSERLQGPRVIHFTSRTAAYEKSFFITACTLWLSLPQTITTAQNFDSFKILLREYLRIEEQNTC